MTWQRWVTVLSLQAVLIGTISFSQRSVADGALAVGVSANIARDGVAAGWAVNHTKLGDAEKKAMELCLGYEPRELLQGLPARSLTHL